MRQGYRPIGSAAYSAESDSLQLILKYYSTAKPGKLTFSCEPILYNRGKGILSYIGSIYYLSKKEINFRSDFLDGRISDFHIDHLKNYARQTPLSVDDKFSGIMVLFENVDFEKTYFIYILFLYEDQDGALYDTEHLAVVDFEEKPSVFDDTKAINPYAKSVYKKEIYHKYNDIEQKKLKKIFTEKNHPLANFIE